MQQTEIPLQPIEKTMVKQAVFLQPLEDHIRADFYPATRAGCHTRASGCTLKEAAAHRHSMLEQAPGRTCNPEEHMQEQVLW